MEKGSELVGKGLAIQSYERLKGKEFKRGDAKFGKDLEESEVPEHPVWLELFHGDKELLGQVAQKMFKAGKDTHGYVVLMGIYLADGLAKLHMRAAVPNWLGGGSWLDCGNSLDNDNGRFVGVAPEALSAPGNLVKPYTQADLQAVDEAIKELDGVVRSELINPITGLRSKL